MSNSTSQTLSNNSRISADDSNMSQKYNGLIHQSTYKKFRTNLVQLFNYVYTVAPQFQTLHVIITAFRIMQIAGPSLLEANPGWMKDQTTSMTVGIVSIFYHLLPHFLREVATPYICYAYGVLSLLMLILIVTSSYIFNKTAKLTYAVPCIIAVYLATFNFIYPPIALCYSAELIGASIFEEGFVVNIVRVTVLPITCILAFVVFAWIYMVISSQTLIFRPTSLMTAMIAPQNYIFLSVNLINFLVGLASYATPIATCIIMIMVIVLYILTALLPFYMGGFTNKNIGVLVTAASVAGAIVSVIQVITKFMDVVIGIPLIFVLILSFIALSGVFKFIYNIIANKRLQVMDKFQETDSLEVFRSPNHLLNCGFDGISACHPESINCRVFKDATNKWPTNTRIWYAFAKLCAIYPEKSTTLSWIYHSILASKLKGSTARSIKEQALTISRQREANLSPNLKLKLANIQKQTTSAKHKIRHVWDLAIQGNISEMESSIKRYYSQLEKCDADFKHLFRQYPNNRFVTRSYARFCKELKANNTEYMEYIEKTRTLQRGISVNEDNVHTLGLLALPSMPKRLNVMIDSSNVNSGDFNQSSFDLTEVEDDVLQDVSVVNNVLESIENLSIPSILCTKVSRILMMIIIFVIPMVAMLIYSMSFVDSLLAPLSYISDLAEITSKTMVLCTAGMHFFYEMIGVYNETLPQELPPVLLGGQYNTKTILQSVIAQLNLATQNVYSFRSLSSTNSHILEAQEIIFGSSVNYLYFTSFDKNDTVVQTLQTGIMDMVAQTSNLLNQANYTYDIVNTSLILNPMYNFIAINSAFENAMSNMISYIYDHDEENNQVALIVMIVAIVVVVVSFTIAIIVQLVWIQRNKEEAYHCLTALPKPTVSALVENLRVLKTDDGNESTTNTDTEMSKQEDNIIKTLLTGGDNSSVKIADRIMLLLGSLTTIVVEVVMAYLYYYLMVYQSHRLVVSSPHLNYLPAIFTQILCAQFVLNLLAVRYDNHPAAVKLNTTKEWENLFTRRLAKSREYFHSARYGGYTKDEVPFLAFAEGVAEANKLIVCTDYNQLPTDFMFMAACTDVESLYILIDAILFNMFQDQQNGEIKLKGNTPMFAYTWTLLISPIYDGLYGPMFNTIIPTIEKELQGKFDDLFPIFVALIVVIVLLEVFVQIQVHNIESHIRSVLKLLLHAPQGIVMSTTKIVSVLNGDFSRNKADITKRSSEFYDNVINLLPDAILVCDQITNNIVSVNKAAPRMLFTSEEDLIDKNIKEFLSSSHFSGDVSSLFKSSGNTEGIEISESDNEGGTVNLQISTMKANNQHVFIFRDITSTVRYNMLIQDERKKSDALLQSILPPSLVKRVQDGEKNISFAVQSATILFMDIVSFTPWCGSLPAQKVMMTLNYLYKKFDLCLAKYSTTTKIKCIGDCYMCAGGIFSEQNNPAEHAKDVVNFGLDALNVVRELDEELNEKLQIRVGINTGGPIVAGVLGIGKPTFEILGPAINMAQQMEHHGIAMAVHISRPVYELIYGNSFKIKERGSVEVKNGSVLTYIVEDKA